MELGERQQRIPLISRSEVRSTPAYLAVAATQRQPQHVLEAIPEGWEHGLKGEEAATYVGEALLDVLGMAGLNNDAQEQEHLHPLPSHTPLVNPQGTFAAPPPAPNPCTHVH